MTTTRHRSLMTDAQLRAAANSLRGMQMITAQEQDLIATADALPEPEPVIPPACERCEGTGQRPLFTSTYDCEDCGGSGVGGKAVRAALDEAQRMHVQPVGVHCGIDLAKPGTDCTVLGRRGPDESWYRIRAGLAVAVDMEHSEPGDPDRIVSAFARTLDKAERARMLRDSDDPARGSGVDWSRMLDGTLEVVARIHPLETMKDVLRRVTVYRGYMMRAEGDRHDPAIVILRSRGPHSWEPLSIQAALDMARAAVNGYR